MESSLRPRRWTLLFTNIILLKIALAFIGVGIWLVYSGQNILSPAQVNNRIYVGKVLISLGVASLLVCLLLFYEIFVIKKMILIFYVIIYVNIFILMASGVIFICRNFAKSGEREQI